MFMNDLFSKRWSKPIASLAGVAVVLGVTALAFPSMRSVYRGLLSTFSVVLLGLGALVLVLLIFYGLTSYLPNRWRERGRVAVFLFPALLVILCGLLVPAVRSIYISLFVDKKAGPKFSWFRNYAEIFSGKDTRLTVVNNVTWVIVGTIATTILALAIARFADGMRGEKAAKSLVFLPAAISLAGAGIIWRFVYASPPFKVGLLNQITGALPGLPNNMGGNGDQLWMIERGYAGIVPPATAPGFNTFLLIIVFIWASTGVSTVILSAAIKGVPDSLIEAAKVDGATQRQVFYKVTLPYIRATIVTVATLTIIAALKAYDVVAAMTGGNYGTSTLANEFMNMTYQQRRPGIGAAMAVLIFVLVIPVIVINRRSQRRAEELMGA
jgi:alpha-glucoside transport system permease protein